jgi:hypothetical protein
MAVICRVGANSIVPKSVFKIHPAIGIARVGDHPDQFFTGPEVPFRTAAPPGSFFKAGGQVKRQGARFRIFDYGDVSATGIPNCEPREINIKDPEVVKIEWTVELANRKASFFQFNGTSGDNGPYAASPFRPFERRRNGGDQTLEITPGPRTATATKSLAPANPGDQFVDAGARFTFSNPKVPAAITTLGELFLDLDGNLVVLGGHGKSASKPAGATLLTYANNDHWFDDVSDGPVTAKVTLKSGKIVTCEGAWMICGPPDFAPVVRNVVTLFDVLWDVAVRLLGPLPSNDPRFDRGWKRLADQKTAMAAYRPSWKFDIEPVILATKNMSAVYRPAVGHHAGTMAINDLFDPDPAKNPIRNMVLQFMRPPPGVAGASGAATMPRLLGDEPYEFSHPRYRATVTPTQYTLFQKWAAGNFIDDHAVTPSTAITPEGLDQAALENCVGAAMYPGIEASWLIRNPRVFKEPFRIKNGASFSVTAKGAAGSTHTESLTVRPGFFTQQMALPWQADFADCKREQVDVPPPPAPRPPDAGQEFGWWPGQRPDETPGGLPWARPTTGVWPAEPISQPTFVANGVQPSHAQMVANVMKFGFIKLSGASFIEDERNPSVP